MPDIPNWSDCVSVTRENGSLMVTNTSNEGVELLLSNDFVSYISPNGGYVYISEEDLIATLNTVCFNGRAGNAKLVNGQLVIE